MHPPGDLDCDIRPGLRSQRSPSKTNQKPHGVLTRHLAFARGRDNPYGGAATPPGVQGGIPMARRGGAEPAQDIRDEIRDLGPPPDAAPSSNTFTDPLRAEESAPSAPSRSAPLPPEGPPTTAPTPEGAGEAPYDARGEINRLRGELAQREQRDAYYQRELALRLAGAQQVAGAPSGQAQIDPTLQQGLDILQVTE